MKTKLFLWLAVGFVIAGICSCKTVTHEDFGNFNVVLESNPTGASVYLNGVEVCQSTPGVVYPYRHSMSDPLLFEFRKYGYETKIVQKRQIDLMLNKKVSCKMKRIAETVDPTIRQGEATNRVTRDAPGKTALERTIIRWNIDSDPRGARVFWRVISSVPDEVKNTNETYLTTTPYEETRSFNILGLSYENSRDVTIEIKVTKRGYEDQVKRFNVRQAIDQQEINSFFELVPKE